MVDQVIKSSCTCITLGSDPKTRLELVLLCEFLFDAIGWELVLVTDNNTQSELSVMLACDSSIYLPSFEVGIVVIPILDRVWNYVRWPVAV